MLFKMYMKYCQRRGWKVTINDCPAAEVIGIDRATFTVEGKDAFGMLRAEAGVHRLVRISPTDDKKRRQTTFAGVEVIPVLPDDIDIEISPDDIRVDVYHASGPGGQGVNTTDSAVRVTHFPSGIVVTCQNERSQIQNKAACMQILKARLYEIELEKRAEALDEIRGPKTTIGFGNQIRSYVLYPYQMVKDLRTGVETSNVEAVLDDGDRPVCYWLPSLGYRQRRCRRLGGLKHRVASSRCQAQRLDGFVSRINPAQGWFLSGESVESNTRRSSKRIRLGALF